MTNKQNTPRIDTQKINKKTSKQTITENHSYQRKSTGKEQNNSKMNTNNPL